MSTVTSLDAEMVEQARALEARIKAALDFSEVHAGLERSQAKLDAIRARQEFGPETTLYKIVLRNLSGKKVMRV